MEIFTDREGTVILKKYSPIGDMADFAEEFAESAGKILGNTEVITDRDQVIAVSGSSVRDLLEKQMDEKGLASLLAPGRPSDLARPRRQEIFACLNRCRELRF